MLDDLLVGLPVGCGCVMYLVVLMIVGVFFGWLVGSWWIM